MESLTVLSLSAKGHVHREAMQPRKSNPEREIPDRMLRHLDDP